MPELAEVETWRRLAERKALEKKIIEVWTAEDTIVMDETSPNEIQSLLKGKTVRNVLRKGKHLWLKFDTPGDLYVHFGMSGSFQNYTDPSQAPSHLKLVLHFENGECIGYRNPRRIGKIRIYPDAAQSPPVAKLGPDPYLDPLDPGEYRTRFHRKKQPVKNMLLDQKNFAGVGNWIADEVLYQTKLNPFTPCSKLTNDQIGLLINRLKDIIALAVEVEADDTRFPQDWLFHHRWGKKAEKTGCGEKIRFDTIGGRTCAWVPERQTLGGT